jgi:porphobilinogen synthase
MREFQWLPSYSLLAIVLPACLQSLSQFILYITCHVRLPPRNSIGIHSLQSYKAVGLQKVQLAGSMIEYYTQLCKSVGLRKKDLIFPLLVSELNNGLTFSERDMVFGMSKIRLKDVIHHIQKIIDQGISSVIIFGNPETRDLEASSALHNGGIVQSSTKKIKEEFGRSVTVITDVCICQYNITGHCGLQIRNHNRTKKGIDNHIDNDSTIDLLSKIAISHAESGADVVAPSSMMDGQVLKIRSALNGTGFENVKIMAFSAKHNSSLYSPFRRAAYSDHFIKYPTINKSTYQLGYSNPRQAIREVQTDIQEGADMITIKPSLAYLDIVSMIRDNFEVPLVVHNVSGEYAMIKAAARNGWIDEEEWKVKSIAAMKRAGAHSVISYFTPDMTRYLND